MLRVIRYASYDLGNKASSQQPVQPRPEIQFGQGTKAHPRGIGEDPENGAGEVLDMIRCSMFLGDTRVPARWLFEP